MFPAVEYVTIAEDAYRRERAAAEFARVGRVRRTSPRRRSRLRRPTLQLRQVRRLAQ